MKYVDPLPMASLETLLRIAALEASDQEELKWTPDGRSVRGLEARGLLYEFGTTRAGKQLVGELAGIAQLAPVVREHLMQRIRELLYLDDELIETKATSK